MDGGATFFLWMATAAAAAGTAIQVDAQMKEADARKAQLKEEMQAAELAALDAENQRLIDLTFANQHISANAGGIDAFASLSLIAMRKFNFEQAFKDISNERFNLALRRSATGRSIGILNMNKTASLNSGILQIAGTIAGGFDAASKLTKTTTTALTKKTGSGPLGSQRGAPN